MAKYNGYANRDTWLVCLWIDNDRNNYRYVAMNKSKLLKMKKSQLLSTLRLKLKFGDKINWSKVQITEVKSNIREITTNVKVTRIK